MLTCVSMQTVGGVNLEVFPAIEAINLLCTVCTHVTVYVFTVTFKFHLTIRSRNSMKVK